MTRHLLRTFTALTLLAPVSQAAIVAMYSSGNAIGTPGAASDPTSQGWTQNINFLPGNDAVGFSDGAQGWRVVDSGNLRAINYNRFFSEGEAFGMDNFGYYMRTVVKFDSDLVSNGVSPAADDYFLPPDNARQNGVSIRVATGKDFYSGIFNIDADSNLFFNDGTTNLQLTMDSSAYDRYLDIILKSDGQSATLTVAGTTVPLTSRGPGAQNHVFFGTGPVTTGSAVFGLVLVDSYVPEPTTGVLLALGSGVFLRLRRHLGPGLLQRLANSDGESRRLRRHSGLPRSSRNHRF
jgi:hypothetical protein